MMQNVKYDSLTGKVYEELGCPNKSTSASSASKSDKTLKGDVATKSVKSVTADDNLSTNDHSVSDTTSGSMTLNRLNDYNQHYPNYHDYYGQTTMDQSFMGSNCFTGSSYHSNSHQFNPYDRFDSLRDPDLSSKM